MFTLCLPSSNYNNTDSGPSWLPRPSCLALLNEAKGKIRLHTLLEATFHIVVKGPTKGN